METLNTCVTEKGEVQLQLREKKREAPKTCSNRHTSATGNLAVVTMTMTMTMTMVIKKYHGSTEGICKKEGRWKEEYRKVKAAPQSKLHYCWVCPTKHLATTVVINHKSSYHHLLCGDIDWRKCVPNDDSFEREGREKCKDVPSKAWKLWFLKTAMILLFFCMKGVPLTVDFLPSLKQSLCLSGAILGWWIGWSLGWCW